MGDGNAVQKTLRGFVSPCFVGYFINIENPQRIGFDDFFFFGELALDGTIKDTSHIFAIVLSLAKKGELKKVVTSLESAKKLGNIEK